MKGNRVVLVLVVVVAGAFLAPTLFGDKAKNPKPHPDTPPVEKGPEFTFEQVNAKFVSTSSRLNDQEKKDAWKSYKGKRVEWQGEVTDVKTSMGDTSIHLRHLQTTPDQDVIVNLRKDQSQSATQVREGQILTYQGNLSLYGSLFGLTLNDGVIVN